MYPFNTLSSLSAPSLLGGSGSSPLEANPQLSELLSMMLGLTGGAMDLTGGFSQTNQGGGMLPVDSGGFGGLGSGFGSGGGQDYGTGLGGFLGGSNQSGSTAGGESPNLTSAGFDSGSGTPSQGAAAVGWAESQLDVSESKNPDTVRGYSNGKTQRWCADFVSKAYENTGGSPFGHQSTVKGILDWGKRTGNFLSKKDAAKNPSAVKKGDVAVWKDGKASHVGLVTGVNKDGTFSTIEGNTSDKVGRRTHSFKEKGLTGFVHPSKSMAPGAKTVEVSPDKVTKDSTSASTEQSDKKDSAAEAGADKGAADTGGADKGGADKGAADAGGADKGGADKGGADKGGADKGGADKGGAR